MVESLFYLIELKQSQYLLYSPKHNAQWSGKFPDEYITHLRLNIKPPSEWTYPCSPAVWTGDSDSPPSAYGSHWTAG